MIYEPDKKTIEVIRKINKMPNFVEWNKMNKTILSEGTFKSLLREYEEYIGEQLKSTQVKKVCPYCFK